ncbi:unnamed protein product, partial [Meganyctiphanes norvegica]
MMRDVLFVLSLILVIGIGSSHSIVGSRRVIYSQSSPWTKRHSYYITKPLILTHPLTLAPVLSYTSAKPVTSAPSVDSKTVTDDTSDLAGCNTDSGPWWTPEYCRQYFLHWAATAGNTTLALSLLQGGYDINLQHNVQRTALHIAAHWGRATMVSLLLSRGADQTLKDMWGYQALELAELRKCDDKEYFQTWKLSCTRAENNYPLTIDLLKADDDE